MREQLNSPEKPFAGTKVYYSGSIKGVRELEPDFPWQLVQYMISKGADVLSEHVAARTPAETEIIRAKKCGLKIDELLSIKQSEQWSKFLRQKDLDWVHQATHVIALVNGPSHGVGMEIQEALRKPQLGFNLTPILCLVHQDMINSLSGMVKGVCPEVDGEVEFYLETYKDFQQAKGIISDFLTGRLARTPSQSKHLAF